MRQHLPEPLEDVDPAALHASLPRPPSPKRPWVAINMVRSVDGGTQLDGLSGGLGGPADREMFLSLRAVADLILVAAGTVRAERYGPPRLTPARRAERRARGQSDVPRLAIVSGSLDLDLDAALFTDAVEPPMVLTGARTDPGKASDVSRMAELITVGDGAWVDLPGALGQLGGLGVEVVLVEGGPSLNGQLLAAGVVDELDLSVSPLLTGPGGKRLTSGPPPTAPVAMRLTHALSEDQLLFLRYVSG